LSTYVVHLFSSGRADEARKRLSAYAARHDSGPVRLLQADLLRKNGDAAGALKVLGSQRGKEGAGTDVAVIATETLLSLGKPELALKTARDALDSGSESAALWVLRARAELALNHPSDAKRSFENAARIDPASPEIKLWLTRVSGLLGQGENSSVKKPITPVDVPASLRKDWPSPRPAAEVAEHGAQYLERVLAIRYERGKELRTTEQWKVEVINAAGVARFRNLEFEFDPLGEEVFLNSVVVRDAAGKVVATGHADDWFVTDDAVQVGQGVASSRKMLQAPVPGLQPGHVLEVVFTRKALGAPKEFRWSSETFSRLTPTVRSMVYLEGDVAEVRAEHSDGVRALDGKGHRAWIADQPVLWHSVYIYNIRNENEGTVGSTGTEGTTGTVGSTGTEGTTGTVRYDRNEGITGSEGSRVIGRNRINIEPRHEYPIPNGSIIYKLINPERNICNITHEEIIYGESYMNCTSCNNNFIENIIKQWFRNRIGNLRTCPTCREIWTNYSVYVNINSSDQIN
jgi:hypothetical protein